MKEVSIKKILNLVGIFIFVGMAITSVTNPSPYGIKEFLLFIVGSACIFYFLVNIYFTGHIGRKVVFISLFILGCFSLYMAYYLHTYLAPY